MASQESQRSSKPGPKPKQLSELVYTPRTQPISSRNHTYSRHLKVEVLKFLLHHKVVVTPSAVYQKPRIRSGMPEPINDPNSKITYRAVTCKEASEFWKIPRVTIQTWWTNRDKILAGKTSTYSPYWPELEEELFTQILTRRKASQLVTVGWIRRTARKIFRIQYPECEAIFTFSRGWFHGFLKRYHLSRRRLTKQASKTPLEYIEYINNFLQFIRRNSQLAKAVNSPPPLPSPPASFLSTVLIPSPHRRFPKAAILNMDETPIPFEYLDGYTYEITGSKTVLGHTDRSGWNKRQATLVLYIFADGIQRIKPKLIFHGIPRPTSQIWQKEKHLYSPMVTVEFNETAYNNEQLFIQWLDEELVPVTNQRDTLLVMDVASFHKTDAIKQRLRSVNITPALIPPGCTSLLQPLDTAVNGPFKQWLQEATEEYMEAKEAMQPDFKWTTSEKRIMTTFAVATAAQRLELSKKQLVQQAFIQCGISIRPDGSEDNLIKIKDIPHSVINFTGWETNKVDIDQLKYELIEEVPVSVDIEEIVLAQEG